MAGGGWRRSPSAARNSHVSGDDERPADADAGGGAPIVQAVVSIGINEAAADRWATDHCRGARRDSRSHFADVIRHFVWQRNGAQCVSAVVVGEFVGNIGNGDGVTDKVIVNANGRRCRNRRSAKVCKRDARWPSGSDEVDGGDGGRLPRPSRAVVVVWVCRRRPASEALRFLIIIVNVIGFSIR